MLPHLDPMHILALHCPQCPFLTLSVTRLFEHCLGHVEAVDCALYQCAHCGIVGTHLGILEEHTKAWHPASAQLPLKQISRCTLQQRSTTEAEVESANFTKSLTLPQKSCLFCGVHNTDCVDLQAHYRNTHNVHNVKLSHSSTSCGTSNCESKDESDSSRTKTSRLEEALMARTANLHFSGLESSSGPVISECSSVTVIPDDDSPEPEAEGDSSEDVLQLEEADNLESEEERRLVAAAAKQAASDVTEVVDLEDEEEEPGDGDATEYSITGSLPSSSSIIFTNNDTASTISATPMNSLPVFPTPEPIAPSGTFVTRYVFHGAPIPVAERNVMLQPAPGSNGGSSLVAPMISSAPPPPGTGTNNYPPRTMPLVRGSSSSKNPVGRPPSGSRPASKQRFTERCVQSLTRNIARWGGTVRLLRDSLGAERFVVRCNFCERDVRLAGKRTWNFTGVHVPSCLSRLRRNKIAFNTGDEQMQPSALSQLPGDPEQISPSKQDDTTWDDDSMDMETEESSAGLRLPVLPSSRLEEEEEPEHEEDGVEIVEDEEEVRQNGGDETAPVDTGEDDAVSDLVQVKTDLS